MLKRPELLKKLEDDFIIHEGKASYNSSLKIYESMWQEGVQLGVLPPKEPLEGIEVDIRVAKVLNSCSKKSSQE